MSKWFTDNGLLSEEGNRLLMDFRTSLDNLMESDAIHDMSDDELRALQSNMSKLVGDKMSKQFSRRIKFDNDLQAMTDEEFQSFMDIKYGPDIWQLVSLEPEELRRANRGFEDKWKKSLEEMRLIGKTFLEHTISNGVRLK